MDSAGSLYGAMADSFYFNKSRIFFTSWATNSFSRRTFIVQFLGQRWERVFNKSIFYVRVSGWWDRGPYILYKIGGLQILYNSADSKL
jgi:hypothetical protein